MDNWVNWIIGPQLLGVLWLVIGYIQYRFPPRKINSYYGYRTESAQKSQETWDEANRYSAAYMIKSGVIVLIAGVIIAIILGQFNMQANVRIAFNALLIIVSGMAPVLFMMVATERHLSKKFDRKQE